MINVFPYHTKAQKRLHELLIAAYVRGRYHVFNDDFIVTQADLDALGQRVGALQTRILQQCVAKITSFLPQEPFDYTAPTAFLDMDALKARPLPEEALAKAIEEKAEALREKAKERAAREKAEEEKEQAKEKEEQKERELEQARKEKEALIEKLKQAGIE